jgi:transcriptional regulator with XRE-family HTH domain
MAVTRHQRIMNTFAKKLKAARAVKFRSAQRFAQTMGLNEHAYRKYERGETEPNFETLVRLCEALDITPNDLLPDGATPPHQHPQAHST